MSSRPLRLLILEDSLDDSELVLIELRNAGYAPDFRCIDNAAKMKEALDEGTWDVILSDFYMPQFRAPEALLILRDSGADIPFIIISGSVGEEAAVQAMKAGASDYLMKGNLARLVPTIEREMRECANRKAKRAVEDQLAMKAGELAKSSDTLRQQTRLLDSVLTNMNEGLVVCDLRGNFLIYNEAARRILKADYEYRNPDDWASHYGIYHPEERRLLNRDELPLVRAIKGEVFAGAEYLVVPSSNRAPSWILVSASPLRDEGGGEIRGGIMTFQDITERKKADLALTKRTSELARSNAELERFAYVSSHDLKEPLRMVITFSQLLERSLKEKLDATEKNYLDTIVEGGRRMFGLVNDLLAYSQENRDEYQIQKVDPAQSLKLALISLETYLKEVGAEIVTTTLPDVYFDSMKLMRVFQNLIVNAIKFHGPDRPRIEIGASDTGKEILFSVRDNGIGIAPQYQEQIFTMFQRLHTRTKYPGNGIGLAICKGIVERAGGKIWVESDPGKGATFYFTIPNRQPSDSEFQFMAN